MALTKMVGFSSFPFTLAALLKQRKKFRRIFEKKAPPPSDSEQRLKLHVPEMTKQKEKWKERRETLCISCCASVHSSAVSVIEKKRKNSKVGQKEQIKEVCNS